MFVIVCTCECAIAIVML